MNSQLTSNTSPTPRDRSAALQGLLLLDIWIRLMIWAAALCITLLVMSRTRFSQTLAWDSLATWSGAWSFATTVTNFILLFNVAYLLALLIVRLPVPRPKTGIHPTDGSVNWNLVFGGLLGILSKARYQAPFPAIFVPQLASIQPFRWLLGRQFGPQTESSFFLDPNIVDPWGVTLGRNVTIGFGAAVAAHLQEPHHVRIGPTIIEDDVVLGAYSGICGNVHIKRGAVIRPYSLIIPGTVIGEGEFWGGVPARRLRDVPFPQSPVPVEVSAPA